MKRIVALALIVGCAGLSMLASFKQALAQDPSTPLLPTIKEIMREAHQCRTAYIRDVRVEYGKEEPNWELITARSRDLVHVGKLLALNTPPKGTPESWEKLTNLYIARATILVDAAERKDLEEGRLVSKRLQSMCASCHRAHK